MSFAANNAKKTK